jgi:DNA-binding CsgD family transcriptional regulator
MDMTAMIGDSSSSGHGRGKRSARSAGERRSGEIRDVVAMPRLAQADRQATAVLMPLLDIWVAAAAFLLGAIARDALGDPDTATRALRHTDVLAGGDRPASPPPPRTRHPETLTHGETRVLRYLPTNLTAREIAGELSLSVNTVKTHQRHLYQKLGARSRTEAVGQACALGLLASSPRGSESLVPPLQSPRLPNSRLTWPSPGNRCAAGRNLAQTLKRRRHP